jgi:3-dehydroquinate dehydratase type I
MRICIPVPARSTAAALRKMEEIYHRADILELRIDRIRNADVPKLLAARKKPVIVTNRRSDEGGDFRGTEEERVGLLKQAVRSGAEYVDIEARTDKRLLGELLTEIRKQGNATTAIFSWHDFSKTPQPAQLQSILEKCARHEGIVKIATMANESEDNLKVLGLIPEAKKMGREIIAFCMGEKGRLSRIAAPLLGSYLSYASLEKGAESAPGQFTAAEMKRILRVLVNA